MPLPSKEVDPRLVAYLLDFLASHSSDKEAMETGVKELERIVRRNPRAEVDYDFYAIGFVYLYFIVNYWKAYLVGRSVASTGVNLPHRIVDLGCGTGAGLVGFLDGSDGVVMRGANHPTVLAVDKNPLQLRFFDQISRPYVDARFGQSVKVGTRQQDMLDFVKKLEPGRTLFLDSSALAENAREKVQAVVSEIGTRFCNADSMLISIEKRESRVLEEVQEAWRGRSSIWLGDEVHRTPAVPTLRNLGLSVAHRDYFRLDWGLFACS